MKYRDGECCECRESDLDRGYTETDIQPVRLVTVRDPDGNRLVKRGYLCRDHVECFLMDGMEVH